MNSVFLRNCFSLLPTILYRSILSRTSETSERLAWIQSLLRRFPYWARGHRDAGSLALHLKKYDLAYASACALKELSSFSHDADLIIARCYLQTGSAQKAYDTLSALRASTLPKYMGSVVAEEFAAAQIALGEYSEARKTLMEISNGERTSAAQCALDYLESSGLSPDNNS